MYGDDPTPGDGLFPVNTSTIGGDGTYDWFVISYDSTDNHESLPAVQEYRTIVDSVAPNIGVTTVDKLYINNQGTFGGVAPPVQVTTNVTDTNLAVASWGIRNDLQVGNSTIYFGCDITDDAMPSIHGWDGSWYFVDGVLVTASISPANGGTDLFVMGEVNGSHNTGDVIGNVMPSHYALFNATGAYQNVYDTQGTFAFGDDVAVPSAVGDTFRAYRYDEGSGYVATSSVSTYALGVDWVSLTIAPIVDGRYAVCVSAIDLAGNDAWTNETTGNPVITVDNIQPTLMTTVGLQIDGNGNGFIDTGDTIIGWVNVTDTNEDATCAIIVDVDEVGFADQAVAGPVYIGGGSWQFTYVVQGPQFTTSNIDVNFSDLAGNQIVAVDNATYEISGTFNLNYVAGWNLMSIPVLNPVVGGVPLATADDLGNQGALMISKWDATGQKYINYIVGFHTPADPQNFALLPDEAYWIWMPGNGAMAIDGDMAHQRNVNVVAGWNLVGYMDPVNLGDVDTDWAPQVSCGPYDDIAYYNGAGFTHYVFSGTVMALTPGTGYFVWSDGPATITYGS